MQLSLGLANRYCTESGDWWRHPKTNLTWSNYTNCVDLQEFKVKLFKIKIAR
jgi:calcitonin receptor-like